MSAYLRQSDRRQSGVALIVALLVVALATVLIAALLDRGELTAARTRNDIRAAQALSYAKGLEAYAAHVLEQDSQNNQQDFADDIWAMPLPPTPVPGGQITASMSDLDGRFNLNNLAAVDGAGNANTNVANWDRVFGRLLIALKLDPNLQQNISDWLNDSASSNDAWYLGQAVPYRPAKRLFSHVSELRLVKGVDGDTYARLLPYVAALPVGTMINVNTAQVPVLMTLNDNLSEQDAAAIWQQGHAHFTSTTTANVSPGQTTLPPITTCPQTCFGVKSSYFLARGDILLDGLTFTFYSLIERRTAPPNVGVHVLLRNRGGE